MYTVVIAERKTRKLFEKYRFLLGELIDDEDVVLCDWNKKGESIASAVPSLLTLIGKRTEWRAVVVTTDGQDRINPFDSVQYADRVQHKQKYSEVYLSGLREERLAAYDKALTDPLMQLAYALCGSPVSDQNLLPEETLAALRAGQITYAELMLEAQLAKDDPAVQSKNLAYYHREELDRLVGKASADRVAAMTANKNAKGIAELLSLREVASLLRLMNNGETVFSDPMFVEQIVENTYKHEILSPLAASFTLQCEKPKEMLCLALRTADVENYVQAHKWMHHDELEYSKFTEYNLYPDAMRFILMDIHEPTHRAYDYDMIRFLSFVLLLAQNGLPLGVVEKCKVYNVVIEDDNDKFMSLLAYYDDKLRRTASALKERQRDVSVKHGVSIDTQHLIQLVETPVSVPVVTEQSFTEEMMLLHYENLGLSKNCPEDEHLMLVQQYKDVQRNFLSFLKSPRHVLAQAAADMRLSSAIDDESALYLDQYQCEDVNDNAYEAEDQIVTTKTADIYGNAKYQAKMEQNEKEIDSLIEIRMTKKTAIVAGLVALGAFFAGFLPLLLSAKNTLSSWGFSLLIAVSATGALFSVGVLSLFLMRRRLRRLFAEFNNAMRSMTDEVRFSMNSFGKYLMNVCSFMRAQSVLNTRREKEKKEIITAKIYQKHINDIEAIRGEIRDAFGKIEYAADENAEAEIYEHDFTQAVDYEYEIPMFSRGDCYMDYMQAGNRIAAPLYYINSIRLRREELYD